ncbi:MAG: tandem-95 repeat protein [Gammaproteobacteria bacterium]|nr:tandem-95 repeat protein [Gammaproteobacteria bacterium]
MVQWLPVFRRFIQLWFCIALFGGAFAHAATVPGAPTIGSISVGNGAVSVSFTAPSDNGGSAITSYIVTIDTDGRTVTGTSSPILVSGLTNGTTYRFNVAAMNVVGTGPVSAWSTAVRPFFRPTITPSNITLSGGTGSNGAFKRGDTITAAWNDSASGDNNVSVTAVSFNFIQFGGGARVATNSGNIWTATYVLPNDTLDSNSSNVTITALNVNGSTNATGTNNVAVDTILPRLNSVSASSANGLYKIGDVLSITPTFSEAVAVAGAPSLSLETGAVDRSAIYSAGSGAATLNFAYQVQSGDTATDLDYLSTSALALNGGSIVDDVGNAAVVTLPAPGAANSLGANKNLQVDGLVPSGYSVAIVQTLINEDNETAFSYTLSGAEVGTSYQYQISSSGGGSPIVGSGSVTSSNQNSAAINVSSLAQGVLTLSLTLTDSAGNIGVAATATVSKQYNRAPILSGLPATSVLQNGTYSFTPVIVDPDGDTSLSFSISNKPAWASFDVNTGTLSGTPSNSDVGTYANIIISATDTELSSALPAFTIEVVNVNDTPTISGSPVTTVAQGALYQFTPVAADIDVGTSLSFIVINQPAWMSFNPATGSLSGTPTNADVGSYSNIQIRVSDGELTATLPAFSIEVTNVNDQPTLSGIPATSVNEDVQYRFLPTANDIDIGDQLTFSISNKPSWATFNASTGELVGTPANAEVGNYPAIVITVSDGVLSASLPAFAITVVNVNDSPAISGIPPTTVLQDAQYLFAPTANDVDVGDVLRFSITNKPAWASFDVATGQLSGAPRNQDVGSYPNISISVSDGVLSASLPAFNLQVQNVNDAPTIQGTPAQQVLQDVRYSFIPTAADIDSNTQLVFSIQNKPSWASFNQNTGELTGTPNNAAVGSYTNIVISVSDGQLTASLPSFNLAVVNVNDAPVITGSPQTTVMGRANYSFLPVASDVDTGTTLVFSISNKPSWASFNTTTGALTGTPQNSQAGVYSNIVISVSDGQLMSALPAFAITVENSNRAPSIQGTPSLLVSGRSAYSFMPIASDPDQGDVLTFSISNKPIWATFNTSTGALTGTPQNNQAGLYPNIVVTVTDGQLSAALPAFTITVESSNRPPQATPGSVVLNEDKTVVFSFAATDAENDPVTFRIVSQPSHGSVSPLGNDWIYTPRTNFNGVDSLQFIAKDAEADSTAVSFTFSVSPVNDEPQANNDQYQISKSSDDRYRLAVLGNDVDIDGDTLTIDGAAANLGTVTFSSAGLDYQAIANYTGPVVLRYTLVDPSKARSSAEVRLNITGSNQQDAPIVTLPADVAVKATGYYTKVDLGVATAKDKAGVSIPVKLLEEDVMFRPGDHLVNWQAIDGAGLKTTRAQRVQVQPLVSLGKAQTVPEGAAVKVQVQLNGPSPVYPVAVPYTVTGTAGAGDHTLTSGVIEISQGTVATLEFDVLEDAVTEQDETVIISLTSENNLSDQKATTVVITESNLAPVAEIMLSQRQELRNIVSRDGGLIQISGKVSDANTGDVLTSQWDFASLAVVSNSDGYSLDPTSLALGVYPISLTVTDNNSPALSATAKMQLVVLAKMPTLGTGDSDGDLIPDPQDGLADDDGDGIVNYLDAISACNAVPQTAIQQRSYLLESVPGTCLRRGARALVAQSGGLHIDVSQTTTDAAATNIGGVFDFEVTALPVAGQSVAIVIPQRQPIPVAAVLRKYLGMQWQDFVVDSKNSIASSAGIRGFCPAPGTSKWQSGLIAGHWCVQLTIEDGGPNDADGLANGVVVDPSGVAVLQSANKLPIAQNDSAQLQWNQQLDIAVLANDSDADSDQLTVSQVSSQLGTVSILSNQQIRYVAPANFIGVDKLIYSISDGNGGTASAEVTVTVNGNRAPTANNDSFNSDDRTEIQLNVLANDVDLDGDTLQIVSATAQQGTVSVTADQKIKYSPKLGFEGTDLVSYQIRDGLGGEASAQVTLTIKAYKEVNVTNQSSGGAFGLGVLALLPLAWRRRRALAMLALASATLPVAASPRDFYLQTELGQSVASKSASDLQNALPSGSTVDLDKSDASYAVIAGFQLTDYWAFELGYQDQGQVDATITGSALDPAAYHELTKTHSPVLIKGFTAGVRYTFWGYKDWSLDIPFGVMKWQNDIVSISGNSVLRTDTDGTDPYYGLHVQYRITDYWQFGFGVQQMHLEPNTVNAARFSLTYRF